jgi:hypothetical protein
MDAELARNMRFRNRRSVFDMVIGGKDLNFMPPCFESVTRITAAEFVAADFVRRV